MRDEVGGLRTEMRQEIGELRSEMRDEVGGVRGEIGGVHGELAALRLTLLRVGGGIMVGLVGVIGAVLYGGG
jgi:hypothetical protein